jgi:hypothetical protein
MIYSLLVVYVFQFLMSLHGAFRIGRESTEKVLWLKTRHTFSDVVESVKGEREMGKNTLLKRCEMYVEN